MKAVQYIGNIHNKWQKQAAMLTIPSSL